ncbi:MAG: hypothetical protein LBR60_08050 [Fibrobacter sp.]|jgi:hypothetical protein|nr:hypothetical protein [Fibrobacter sp.]
MKPQFSVIVYPKLPEPVLVEDKALEWFDGGDLNGALSRCEGEWVIIAHESCIFSRDLLHRTAALIDEFRHADAFAPWAEHNGAVIASSAVLNLPYGISFEKDFHAGEFTPMRYAAGTSPLFSVISRRILQRTGSFDPLLKTGIRFLDFGLRLYHAGGIIFSAPPLRVQVKEMLPAAETDLLEKELAYTLLKNLDGKNAFPYLRKHLHTLPFLLKNFRSLRRKQRNATSLSKMNAELLKQIGLG